MTIEILNWSQAFASTSDVCGGKAWNLARLHHYGFAIPEGGVITAGLYRSIADSQNIRNLTGQVCDLATGELLSAENQLLGRLRQAIAAAPLPPSFAQMLAEFLDRRRLFGKPLAVRSSATLEDGSAASFAGMHDTALNIQGPQNIEQAILRCFASLWSARAVAYRRRMNIADSQIAAAVVLCEMVDAQSAGVAFSCDPATGRLDAIAVDANYGLGESVVAGAVDPDRYRIDRFDKSIIDRRIGRKLRCCRAKSAGGTEWVDTASPELACLSYDQIRRLAGLCARSFMRWGRASSIRTSSGRTTAANSYCCRQGP